VQQLQEQIAQGQFNDMSSVDGFLLGEREFTETEQAYYRKPFLIPGEDPQPKLSFGLPVDGKPKHVVQIVGAYGDFLANSNIPELLIRAEPGHLLTGRLLEFARTWPNQQEVMVAGHHFLQERSPDEIGEAIATFVRAL
jgi:haloalkane dehalogenase